MGQYERYRDDAEVLALIGAALREQHDPARSAITPELREKALLAWQRDEQDPLGEETPEQRGLRARAASLALIGLSVEEAGDSALVALQPDTFAEAVAAATDER